MSSSDPATLVPSPTSSVPKIISLRTITVKDGGTFDWHSHQFDEFTLVSDDKCIIGYPPGLRDIGPNTLLHYRPGERHGAWVSPRQRSRFWVIHFVADSGFLTGLRQLGAVEPGKRLWALTPEQSETFQWLFLQLYNEHSGTRMLNISAASAWLQLLLVNVVRWLSQVRVSAIACPTRANVEVVRLWHLINDAVGKSKDELATIYAAPNYDSVRHAFHRTFGCSPREMLLRVRIEHAKNLLLESSLSIKEISLRIGCVQQHEFSRIFFNHTGVSPSKWRTNPMIVEQTPRRQTGLNSGHSVQA